MNTINNCKIQYKHNIDASGNILSTYECASVISAIEQTDYYAHGSVMPGRNYVGASAYRYGYQGQFAEKDPETNKDNFELRQWDGLLGKWSSTDPYGQYHSPYLGMSNNPVNFIDPNGGFDTKLGAWLYSAFNGGEVGYATDKGEWYVGGQFELTKDFGVGYQRTFEFQSSIFNSFNNSLDFSRALSFGGYNIDNAVNYLNAHAYPAYDPNTCGRCARAVRLAIEAGGINTSDRNANPNDPTSQYYAKNWGPYLSQKGFSTINGGGYSPMKGDIRVWEAYLGQKSNAGHIDMYNGNQWLSDFKQNHPIWPGTPYRKNNTPFQIFRWGTYP